MVTAKQSAKQSEILDRVARAAARPRGTVHGALLRTPADIAAARALERAGRVRVIRATRGATVSNLYAVRAD